jgi:hypothetical protein
LDFFGVLVGGPREVTEEGGPFSVFIVRLEECLVSIGLGFVRGYEGTPLKNKMR